MSTNYKHSRAWAEKQKAMGNCRACGQPRGALVERGVGPTANHCWTHADLYRKNHCAAAKRRLLRERGEVWNPKDPADL